MAGLVYVVSEKTLLHFQAWSALLSEMKICMVWPHIHRDGVIWCTYLYKSLERTKDDGVIFNVTAFI